MSFDTVLIANRGAIACRIIRTLKAMGLRSVAVYSDADAGSLHAQEADMAIRIGAGPAAESYLDVAAILHAAKESGAGAIHPGYGFLAENAGFAEACAAAGITFIGPTTDNIRAFGLKHSARALAIAHGIPLAPGTDLLVDVEAAVTAAAEIGYPIMLKATAGGGGIGMRVCRDEAAVRDGFASVARMGAASFGDAGVFLERYVERARHIEVQIFGDGNGRVVALGERDCSLQRRNQKVVEEAPAPNLPAAARAGLIAAAIKLGEAARYRNAGTVEFLYDEARQDFFFLEVNTRLQVEHGVTEQVMGIDLVEWMIRGAAGDFSFLANPPNSPKGASIQVRVYAEDPALDYRPTSGLLTNVRFPDARVETWIASGSEVSSFYDPMLAKIIVTADDREAAVKAMQVALDDTALAGIETNLRWLRDVVRTPAFVTGAVSTKALESVVYRPHSIRVLSGGTATSVQDFPGRTGYWAIGVPPSGPMDDLSFRLSNRLLGNPDDAAGLEITATGPSLLFNTATTICLTGADFAATLDGVPVPRNAPIAVAEGQQLTLGRVRDGGVRGYLALAGGLDIPAYLGSRSTFDLGEFGGHAARRLLAGDTLHLGDSTPAVPSTIAAPPPIGTNWQLRVLYGPHGAPDFFTPDDIETFTATSWKVHYNSNRTGVRLIGPKPHWARQDGGEAGLHPSNIHDNPYAIGAIDFTGDMPIILGPDGPSLGGFVCPFTVIAADLWKVGQLAAGDSVQFAVVTADAASAAATVQADWLAGAAPAAETTAAPQGVAGLSPILADLPAAKGRPRTVYRQQGDRNILVEYGPIVLDLELRIRIHALMIELERMALPGVIDIVPGIRSLQLHFDGVALTQAQALAALIDAEERLGGLDDFTIPSRIIHLPLSWKDPAIYQTIAKYQEAVRDDAPWCPDNIEFIRRINGLSSIDDVHHTVFNATYLVMGLGDVYLGAPVATPIDPRHRLVTTKYNPARTWTPPNVVGIGGAYMCIYGMEGPGGYQLFGRTIQVWNTHRQTDVFIDGKPWLLRFFDQIRFFPVSHDELTEWRRDFPLGRRSIRVEENEFRLADYRAFLADNATSIDAFQQQRQAAFDEERADWERKGEFDRVAALTDSGAGAADEAVIALPDGCECVEAPFGGVIWKMLVSPGDEVGTDTHLAIIEAMKMEFPVEAPGAGIIEAVYVSEKQAIQPGAPMFAFRRAS
jgi:urea carboxylase